MSHIPASKMPHAKPHDDADDAQHGNENSSSASDHGTSDQDGGVVDTLKEQAAKVSETASAAASSASASAKSAAAAAGDKAGAAADAAAQTAKKAADKVDGLPTYAKLIGAAALIGGIAAIAFLPFLQQPEETGRGKRKKNKPAKKA